MLFQAHDLPPGPIVRTRFSRQGGYEAAVRLLNWPTRPHAIFAASDQLCTGALKAIREAGRSQQQLPSGINAASPAPTSMVTDRLRSVCPAAHPERVRRHGSGLSHLR